MKILIFGANGQVGWELRRALAPLGERVALARDGDGELCGDLRQTERIADTVRRVHPKVVVNAAAYTAVDQAEAEPDHARLLNTEAPAAMARAAREVGAWFVHFSTDYVFDGSGTSARDEEAATGPLNTYGRTKLDGELGIRSTGARHLIFRTSWVFAARGRNFALTMLRLATERDELAVVADQYGAPTGAELIADVTAHALRETLVADRTDLGGTYHLTAGGETSWHGYACHLLHLARAAGHPVRVAQDRIRPISSTEFETPARRPLNSRLSSRKLTDTFGLALPHWTAGVERVLSEVLECRRACSPTSNRRKDA